MVAYVPLYVDRWLAGTAGLSREEKGAFIDWIASYAARDGLFPDDLGLFATVWGCDIRVAKRLRGALMAKGKLYVEGDLVHQVLIKSVVANAIAKSAVCTDAAFKRWENYRKNNGGGHANADADALKGSMRTHMQEPGNHKEERIDPYLGESQQPPPVEKVEPVAPPPQTPQPPQALADLNQRMGWSPAGTRKPFT
jgi:uncharacterized protein YdaU (DUF1376 family)